LIYKILGAASYLGKSIDEICDLSKYIMANMNTSGISTLKTGNKDNKIVASLEKEVKKK